MSVEELIDLYGDDILRLCLMYTGDRQLAEDAFQETFIKAWKHLPAFRGESSVRTWLVRIAANTCKSLLRSGWFRMRKRSQDVAELLDLSAPEEASDLDLASALAALPGKYREAVLLHYYENMTAREIGQMLHIPANTVSNRLRTARRLMRAALEGDEDP